MKIALIGACIYDLVHDVETAFSYVMLLTSF